MKSPETKACVLFPGALGDFICFLPALQTIARQAEVDVFARSEFGDLVPSKIAVASLERPEIRRLFTPDLEGFGQTQKFFSGYGQIYSWFGSQQPEFVERLSAASLGKARVFPFRPAGARLHQVDHYLHCLNQRRMTEPNPVIELRADALRWRDEFWPKHAHANRPILALGSGSGAREKNWPEEFFVRVAEWWQRATGGAVVLLIGPVEQERGEIERLHGCCVPAAGLRLSEVAALITDSDLYIGNDSGLSHLAAALGTRTVVLFGPSDPQQWAPRGNRVTVVRHDIHCSPCEGSDMKSCLHRSCLTGLYPKEVIERLKQLPEVITLTRPEAGITVPDKNLLDEAPKAVV